MVVVSASFGILVAFLGVHGFAVLWTVRRQGRGRLPRMLLWLVVLSFILSQWTVPRPKGALPGH